MRTRILGGIAALVLGLVLSTDHAHAVGTIIKLTITPATAQLSAGSSQPLTVQGEDAAGAASDMTANAVFTTTDPLGTTKGSTYTAGKSGTWAVTATYNTLSATAEITVAPGPVAEITVNPNSAPEFIVKGSARTFKAVAYDAYNNIVTAGTIDWTADGGIGTIKQLDASSAQFSGAETGQGTITAYSAGVKTSVDVTVTNPPATNTNSSGTGAATTNANANQNTNVNTNASTNESTDAPANASESVVAPVTENTDAASSASSCKAWSKSTWVWVYLGYVALLILSLYPIRRSRVAWWWIAPLALTVIALWAYFQFRCYPVYPALPYLILLTGIVATSWYNWQRTATPPTQ